MQCFFLNCASLAFNHRIIAIIYIFIFHAYFHYFDDKNFLIHKFKNFLIALILTTFFIFLFWPYLWIDPINNLIDYFMIIKSQTLYTFKIFI